MMPLSSLLIKETPHGLNQLRAKESYTLTLEAELGNIIVAQGLRQGANLPVADKAIVLTGNFTC